MPAVYLSCAWLLGTALAQRLSMPLALALVGLAPLPLLFLFRRRTRLIVLSSLSLIVFFSAAAYAHPPHSPPGENDLRFFNGQGTVQLTGMVSRDPDVRPNTTHLELSASQVTVKGIPHQVSGTALVFVPVYPVYHYGDILTATGKLEPPPVFDGFDYAAFLAQQDVYSTMTYPQIEVTRSGGTSPLALVYAARDRFSATLARFLPEPQASLAQAMTLGMRRNIPQDIMDDFVRTGTAHLLAISGIHLTIVAGILVTLTVRMLGRRHYFYVWITLAIVWLYALLTGPQTPVVRASIMFSLFLAADLFGRQRSGVAALFLAAAVMVGFNPKLLSQASFQMSFMAMAGLIFVCPPVQSLTGSMLERFARSGRMRSAASLVLDSLSISAGAVIATWPLIAYHFGLFSWVGPFATALALPAMTAIIVASIVAATVGSLVLPLGQAIAWLAWLPLSYLLLAVGTFAAIPAASIPTGQIAPVLIGCYYAGLGLTVLAYHQRQKVKAIIHRAGLMVSSLPAKWTIPPLLTASLLVWLVVATMPDDNLHIDFLDVGQGDAILIQEGRRQVLVDGGPDPQALALAISRKMPFWDRTIETVVLTHPDADHLGGLVGVLKRYNVQQVLSANTTDNTALYQEWLRTIDTGRIPCATISAGQDISLGDDVTLRVLNPRLPLLTETESDLNNNCLVLRLTDGQLSVLLTGDLGAEGEQQLVSQRADLASTILKVGHHGSAGSTSQEFLSVVDPQIAVISVGKDNSFGHPNPGVLGRLTEQLGPQNVYRTDQSGTIEFITDGRKLWVKTDR